MMLLLGTILSCAWIHIWLVVCSVWHNSTSVWWISIKCCSDVRGTQRINLTDFSSPTRLPLFVSFCLLILWCVQKTGDYSFRPCNKWECRAPAVRLSGAPINTIPVFSVTTIITIIIRRNDTLFGRQQKVKSQGLAAHDVSMAPMCVQTAANPPTVMSLGCSDVFCKSLASSAWSHQQRVAGKRWKFNCDAFTVAGCREQPCWRANVWD